AISERALQQARTYAAERLQGQALGGSDGPVSIDRHPDVQRMLLTMQALTEAGRAIALCAAAQVDHSKGAADDAERARRKATYEFLVPIVKAFCTESAVEVTSLGVQVHGGMGYIEETGAAQYYRDARILPIYEGTTAIQANDFVGRKILRDGGAVAMDVAQQIQVTIDELRSAAPNAGADSEALNLIAERLSRSLEAYTSAIQ